MEHRWVRQKAEIAEVALEGGGYELRPAVLWRCTCGDELYCGPGTVPRTPCGKVS